jgi:hypothetical protein
VFEPVQAVLDALARRVKGLFRSHGRPESGPHAGTRVAACSWVRSIGFLYSIAPRRRTVHDSCAIKSGLVGRRVEAQPQRRGINTFRTFHDRAGVADISVLLPRTPEDVSIHYRSMRAAREIDFPCSEFYRIEVVSRAPPRGRKLDSSFADPSVVSKTPSCSPPASAKTANLWLRPRLCRGAGSSC